MANNFFIAYDLDSPGQNYSAIEKAILSCGSVIKAQMSLYYLHSPLTKEQILERCKQATDSNDLLIVIEASNAIWTKLLPHASEFIVANWNT